MKKRTVYNGDPPHSDVRDFLVPWVVVGLHVTTQFSVTHRHWKERKRAQACIVLWHTKQKKKYVASATGVNATEACAHAALKALGKTHAKLSKPHVHYSKQDDVLKMTWGAFVRVVFEKDDCVEVGTVGHFPDPAHAVAHAVVKAFNKFENQKAV
jgi:hypothetical protein